MQLSLTSIVLVHLHADAAEFLSWGWGWGYCCLFSAGGRKTTEASRRT